MSIHSGIGMHTMQNENHENLEVFVNRVLVCKSWGEWVGVQGLRSHTLRSEENLSTVLEGNRIFGDNPFPLSQKKTPRIPGDTHIKNDSTNKNKLCKIWEQRLIELPNLIVVGLPPNFNSCNLPTILLEMKLK